MPFTTVTFEFVTGLKRSIFRNPRLAGTWDSLGRFSEQWTETPMTILSGEDGCPMFSGTVLLDLADSDRTFQWGVILDGPQGANFWGIPSELDDVNSSLRHREFRITDSPAPQTERYYFTHCRRLGANKRFIDPADEPDLRFAVWAPNAIGPVDVVFGDSAHGYIGDDGMGIDAMTPAVPLTRGADGVWEGSVGGTFADYMGRPYMYRIVNGQGDTVYRTDIFSRSQIGKGKVNPTNDAWDGNPDLLDGAVSCSVVIDPDVVRRGFASTPAGEDPDLIPAEEFWASEFTVERPVSTRVEDLVIYELHIGSLGFDKATAGDLSDAMAFLNHLNDLGVNAVELLPMAEFGGNVGWGYGSTHHFCIESSAGGRDKYRHFVRECHRRGIAVIQDVVYNHYDPSALRAEWQYDSTAPEQNIYYWYEGRASDYPFEDGGYVDNGSTGFTPRFWEEAVRQQFISAAAFLIEEMHVDGLRVDLTQAIHRDNSLHAEPHPGVASANIFGQKFLRQWSRTLHMIKPTAMLIAEDHTGWDAVTKLPAQGGLGFNAKWEVQFYHSLVGDSDMAGDTARLLKTAGFGGDDPLAMDRFSGALFASQFSQVVFHESHDEAGNAGGTARTIVTAVNDAALVGATRDWAEARARVCFGLSLLSAGTPMFFMGEEVGAAKKYTYNNFISNREDIFGLRAGVGGNLFRFCQDLITLRGRLESLRAPGIDILHQSNNNRVVAFKRWAGGEQVIIAASLRNAAFANGYVIAKDDIAIPDGRWREVFNSDSMFYGGWNVGNGGRELWSLGGVVDVVIPAVGFVVLVRQ